MMDTPAYCECGCGELAPIAARTDRRRGMTQGEPIRFIRGHNVRIRPTVDDATRFWAKVDKTETCWLWTASTRRGYGRAQVGGVDVSAHRWAYEQWHGESIPDDLCRVRACVNPEHMEIVTRGENARRAAPTLLTNRCKWDHEFTPENTYNRRDGARQCLTCAARRRREYANVG